MIHSIKLSEKNFGIISDSLEGFEDNSWVNDACDSVYSEVLDIGIYFPTSENPSKDNENEFDTFSVILNQERFDRFSYPFDEPIHYSFKTIEEVIDFVKANQN